MSFLKQKQRMVTFACLLLAVFAVSYAVYRATAFEATNIKAEATYAWNENGGWLNFGSTSGGVMVNDYDVTGYAWSENLGWISLNCSNDNSCGTSNYKISNDGEGNLTGYAWSENAGWINFSPADGGVSISSTGEFSGYAWGENIGWLVFNCQDLDVCASSDFKVRTTWLPLSARPSEETEGVEISDVHYSSTDATIVINWDTNHNADGHLRWGTDKNLEKEKNDNEKEKKHRIVIKDLEPNTQYFFRIKSTDENDNSDTSKIYSVSTKAASAIFARRNWQMPEENKTADENLEKVNVDVSDENKKEEPAKEEKKQEISQKETAPEEESTSNGIFSVISGTVTFVGREISGAASAVWNGIGNVSHGIYETALGVQRDIAKFIGGTEEKLAGVYDSIISKFSTEKAAQIARLKQVKFYTAQVFNRNEKKLLSEVRFQILDKKDEPIANLETTLFSDPQTSTTDENGVASFKDVPIGSHTLAFDYQGEEFRKKVAIADTLTEEGKVRAEVVEVKAEKEKIAVWMWGVMLLLIIAVTASAYFAGKYYQLKKNANFTEE